jgi:hypothetical protein
MSRCLIQTNRLSISSRGICEPVPIVPFVPKPPSGTPSDGVLAQLEAQHLAGSTVSAGHCGDDGVVDRWRKVVIDVAEAAPRDLPDVSTASQGLS